MHQLQIIHTVQDAEVALQQLAARRFARDLAELRRIAARMRESRAGSPGLAQAQRAVQIGFAGNVELLGECVCS